MNEPGKAEAKVGERIFLGSMWIVSDFGPLQERYNSFVATIRPRIAQLLDGLLLYERVVVPTQDFMVLTALIEILGEDSLVDLLEHDEVHFVRLKGSFAYGGNGAGIVPFEIAKRTTMEPSLPVFMDTPKALDVALGVLRPKVTSTVLRGLVLQNTLSLSTVEVKDVAIDETYKDVMGSRHLAGLFPDGSDLRALPGIGPNEMRCYSPRHDGSNRRDLVDLILQLSNANLELKLAEASRCMDGSTFTPVGHLIRGKLERALGRETPLRQWCLIRELDDQPNTTAYILAESPAERPKALQSLMKVKRDRNGVAYRRWFHEHCRGDALATAKEYAKVIREVPLIDRLPGRTVRFMVACAAGLAVAPLGIAAGIADGFFASRLLRGSSAKYFLENLRQLR